MLIKILLTNEFYQKRVENLKEKDMSGHQIGNRFEVVESYEDYLR